MFWYWHPEDIGNDGEMKATILDVDLVERLQRAVAKGKSIETFISALTSATLPGLVEYGCLRSGYPSLPRLPQAIVESELGCALERVPSPMGLRWNGTQRPPPALMTPQRFEFIVVLGEPEVTSDRWFEFASRLRLSAKAIGFSMTEATDFGAAVQEMADNAVLHSSTSVGALIGYRAIEESIVCTIADVGVGVLASLRTSPRYKHLKLHSEAIRTALKEGESRLIDRPGGFGFNEVFKTMAKHRGTVRFRSGEAAVSLDGQDDFTDISLVHSVDFRPGFQVTICCRSSDRSSKENLI